MVVRMVEMGLDVGMVYISLEPMQGYAESGM